MDLLNEARVQLESVVSEDLLKQYFAILRQWFLFNSAIDTDEFDRQARKLLLNKDQIVAHNRFLRALLDKTSSDTIKLPKNLESVDTKTTKHKRSSESENEKFCKTLKRGTFQPVDFGDFVRNSSSPPNDLSSRSAASELFMPDHSFISTRILLAAWENGLQGAESNVAELILSSCQIFVKNILTAMITRKKGYKVRERKFQYGFNQPIPDPFLRNYGNIMDDSVEARVDVLQDEDSFLPRLKPSLERMEQQVAFAFSSAKRRKIDSLLTVRFLYDTLKERPELLGSDASHTLHMLKLNVQLD